jgi:hypothetical protein
MGDRDDRWSCPSCGFHVYNRRYPKCESCGAALPEALLLSPAEREALADAAIASIDAQMEEARRARLEAAELREKAQVTDSDALALLAATALITSNGES